MSRSTQLDRTPYSRPTPRVPMVNPSARRAPMTRVAAPRHSPAAARPGSRVESRRCSSAIRTAIMFFTVVGITVIASSLIGQALMETARRDRIRATDRARAVSMDLALLQDRLDSSRDQDASARWASLHRLTLPSKLGSSSDLAAITLNPSEIDGSQESTRVAALP